MVPEAALELSLEVASGSPPELPHAAAAIRAATGLPPAEAARHGHAAAAIRAATVAMVTVILLSFTVPLLPLVMGSGRPPYAATTESLHQGGY